MSRVFEPFLVFFGAFLSLLPNRVRLAFGNGLGASLGLLGLRRKVVVENLQRCYPAQSDAERAAMTRAFYRHFGNLLLEVFMIFGWMGRFVRRSCKATGVQNWQDAHDLGKGVIYLSSHVGNWEVMVAQGGLLRMDLLMVTKRLKPDWLHRLVERSRARTGVSGTYEPRTLKDVLRQLSKGGTVGFVLDQYAGPPIGVRVPFLGSVTGTSSAVAMIAKRSGAAVVPVVTYRAEDGTHRIDVLPRLEWIPDENPQRELALNTAHYVAALEKFVRQHPEQWLWIHRRFKGDTSPLKEGEWEAHRVRA